MVGDMKNGRTVHSLARLLALYDVKINYVSPEALSMPGGIIKELAGKVSQFETTDLDEVIEETDVLYVTRVQTERFDDTSESELHRDSYVINSEMMRKLPDDSVVMHPLPRLGEIHPEVDNDPRAIYFEQVKNGMYVRMGLLALVNGRSVDNIA
jgi:aspartate carbamoyltransferase catalytic subunit